MIVASAYPDLRFVAMQDRFASSDIVLIRAGGLGATCDAVLSATTITPKRAVPVLFSKSRLESNQGAAVLPAGIRSGNTSDLVARCLLEQNGRGELCHARHICSAAENMVR